MDNPLTHAQDRALQYWFVDGLAELSAGVVSVLLAGLFSLWQVFFTWRWSLPVLLLAGLAGSFGLRLVIQRIKERSTYPHTGYVAPLTGLENRRAAAVLFAFTILLLGLNYYLTRQGAPAALWSPALAGLVFGFFFIWTGVLTRLQRLIFLGGFSCLLGIVLSLLAVPFFTSLAIVCAAAGGILIVLGVRTRRQYLRQTLPLIR